MAELTNLTDRISHLRERKGNSPFPPHDRNQPRPPEKKQPSGNKKHRAPERRFANDYFMVFVYATLGLALAIQLGLIVWLDII
jgi:hypothetical protein